MNRRLVHRLTGVVVVAVVAGGLSRFVGDLGLSGAAGVVCGLLAVVTLRLRRRGRSTRTGRPRDSPRWRGLTTGVITLAALVGVSPTLPVSAELRLGLALLVLATGYLGYVAGIAASAEGRGVDDPGSPDDSGG